jgi:hypothetical protein
VRHRASVNTPRQASYGDQYARAMPYVTNEARQHLLDTIAEAIEEIALALSALTAAYEQLDEYSADRLEEELFRPVQTAYGRARRTHTGFAERHGLPTRTFEPTAARASSRGVGGLLDIAIEAVEEADGALTDLQDSMRPVEVGDPELRAGLADVRELLGDLGERARRFVSTLGR